MTRADLIHSMQSSVDGASFINVTELCMFLGVRSREKVKNKYLRDLDRIGQGYFIPDVAARIMERRTI